MKSQLSTLREYRWYDTFIEAPKGTRYYDSCLIRWRVSSGFPKYTRIVSTCIETWKATTL